MMVLSSCFTFCGGLALFLYGMMVLSHHLEQLAGHSARRLLDRMTSSIPKGLLLGAAVTIALQSSSAMTVMLVGLVNAGVMPLCQTLGVIMGSNIGTTLTPWILALAGVERDSLAMQALTPLNLSASLAMVGVLEVMLSSRSTRRYFGHILVGFFLLLQGMELMSLAASPLTTLPGFAQLIKALEDPLQGILIGALFTGMIQSSAASIGILQTLSMTGSITWSMAIPVILGQNIGTCVTALLSSIGTCRSARHVALLHIGFNGFGAAVCMLLLFCGTSLVQCSFLEAPIHTTGIALCHTVFNLLTTLLLLPLYHPLEHWITKQGHSPFYGVPSTFR